MKRTPMPPRSRPMARAAMKRKSRSVSEFARIYGSRARVAWIKAQPCVACGRVGQSENAHTESGGMGRKADAEFIVPLCILDHRRIHAWGVLTFEARYAIHLRGRTLKQWAAHFAAEWQERAA